MINEVIIQGRLTRDPDLRHTKNNKAVSSFTVAVDRSRKTDGQPEADFIQCIAWGKTAEFMTNWFEKGQAIVLSGRLQTRNYEDKNGNKRVATEVVAREISFGGPKRSRGNTTDSQSSQPNYDLSDPSGFETIDDDDGEVPF